MTEMHLAEVRGRLQCDKKRGVSMTRTISFGALFLEVQQTCVQLLLLFIFARIKMSRIMSKKYKKNYEMKKFSLDYEYKNNFK